LSISWNISAEFQTRRFGSKSKPEFGMLHIWQRQSLQRKSEKEMVSYLMTPPHTPPFYVSSINGIENRVSESCSVTSVPLSPQSSSHTAASQTTFHSMAAKDVIEGIVLPDPEPPLLILVIREDSARVPLSLVSIEGKLPTGSVWANLSAYQL
jgi:hypothetical protein